MNYIYARFNMSAPPAPPGPAPSGMYNNPIGTLYYTILPIIIIYVLYYPIRNYIGYYTNPIRTILSDTIFIYTIIII